MAPVSANYLRTTNRFVTRSCASPYVATIVRTTGLPRRRAGMRQRQPPASGLSTVLPLVNRHVSRSGATRAPSVRSTRTARASRTFPARGFSVAGNTTRDARAPAVSSYVHVPSFGASSIRSLSGGFMCERTQKSKPLTPPRSLRLILNRTLEAVQSTLAVGASKIAKRVPSQRPTACVFSRASYWECVVKAVAPCLPVAIGVDHERYLHVDPRREETEKHDEHTDLTEGVVADVNADDVECSAAIAWRISEVRRLFRRARRRPNDDGRDECRYRPQEPRDPHDHPHGALPLHVPGLRRESRRSRRTRRLASRSGRRLAVSHSAAKGQGPAYLSKATSPSRPIRAQRTEPVNSHRRRSRLRPGISHVSVATISA